MQPGSTTGLAFRLQAELEAFREFQQFLQQEQAALTAGDIDRLLQLAPAKTTLMEKLFAFSAERDHALAAAGHENTATGIAAWFNAIGADGETRELWNRLLALAREAEQANRRNGILIETHLRHNQQALAVLRTAANPNSLYGPNGQISSMTSGRPLGKV
ncbi:MAG: flagella synthesis protein FlgN [Sulfurimicrobium sp.]